MFALSFVFHPAHHTLTRYDVRGYRNIVWKTILVAVIIRGFSPQLFYIVLSGLGFRKYSIAKPRRGDI